LGKGDFSAVVQPVGGISEIRSLQARMGEMADNLRKARESLQGYIGSITRGVEEERLRLSRDLHDDTIQSLIALKYRLQTAKEVDTTENPKLVQKVIEDLRRLVRGLRPVILEDLGLAAALENLCQQMEQEDGIPTIFRVTGSESRFSGDVELAFYRIAQEGLMNIQKHSAATRVELNLKYRQDSLDMELMDNGKGFEIPDRFDAIVAEGHFGLIGMMERAGLINADIDLKSKPGEGTILRVHYPEEK
jgi:signal transduction histidine kinase